MITLSNAFFIVFPFDFNFDGFVLSILLMNFSKGCLQKIFFIFLKPSKYAFFGNFSFLLKRHLLKALDMSNLSLLLNNIDRICFL